MESKKALGLSVKQHLKAAGLTQVQLAKAAGLSGDWVCAIERGHRRPDLCTLMHLAHALRVSLDDLCGFDSNHNGKPKKGK